MQAVHASLLGLDLSVRSSLFVLFQILLFLWTRYVVAPAKVGTARIARCAPLVPVLILLTMLFDVNVATEFIPAVYCSHNFLWLTAAKLWAFCMNRGQLVGSYESGNNAAFALGLVSPITVAFDVQPVSKKKDSSGGYRDAVFKVPHYTTKEILNEALDTVKRLAARVKDSSRCDLS